jgi:hypothetical protein
MNGLILLASFVLSYQAILLAFLDHVFLYVGNITVAGDLFLMTSSVNVAVNFSSFVYLFFCLPES